MSEKRQANGESAGATAVGGERMKQRSPLRARAAEETKRREAPLKAPRVPRISRWGREREGGGRVRRRHVSPREPPAPSPPAICGRGRAATPARLFCGRRRFPRRYPAAAAPGMRTAAGLRRGHRTFREPPPSPRPLPAGVGGGGAGGAFPARYLRACAAGDEGCGRASAGTPVERSGRVPGVARQGAVSPAAICGGGTAAREPPPSPRPLSAGVGGGDRGLRGVSAGTPVLARGGDV